MIDFVSALRLDTDIIEGRKYRIDENATRKKSPQISASTLMMSAFPERFHSIRVKYRNFDLFI